MAREMSEQAKAAKLIRQWLKAQGIKCRVRSSSFSMGDSVDVTVYDRNPEQRKEIEAYCNQYQYGHFDGMTDMYENSNRNGDFPQSKYVTVQNEISDELHQKALDFVRANYQGGEDLAENYAALSHNARIFEEWAHSFIYQVISGYRDTDFWKTTEEPAEEPHPATQAVTINKEKNGVEIRFDSIPSAAIRTELKANGWRWSRFSKCWYNVKTPKNLSFALLLDKGAAAKPSSSKPTPQKKNIAAKLRTTADKMQTAIDNKLADRLTNTQKRVAQAAHARMEGERLTRTQKTLRALADLHESETLPNILTRFTSKASIYELMGTVTSQVSNGWHGYAVCTGEPRHTTEEATVLWSLIGKKTDEERRQDDLRRRIEELQFSKIPGYFPTPSAIAQKMVQMAEIEPTDSVLEPSAGCGNILKELPECEIMAIEQNYSLHSILVDSFNNIKVEQADFLQCNGNIGSFDKIVMNPPFDMAADIKHINHALAHLKPGGRLVALCAGGARQHQAFENMSTHWEELPAGSFKEAGTGVNVSLMVIDK